MKKLTSILLILALVLSLAACSQTKQPDVNGDSSVSTSGDNTSPIPIAFIGSMTGLDEIYGYVSYSAAKMAVEQINEAGGVAGRQIELKCYDDRAEGIEAVNCARKAILDDGCVAILTASSTAGLISINAVLEEFEVLYEQFVSAESLKNLKAEYESRLANKDNRVNVLAPSGAWQGICLGIKEDGALLVQREDGNVEEVIAGEVSVRGIYGYV